VKQERRARKGAAWSGQRFHRSSAGATGSKVHGNGTMTSERARTNHAENKRGKGRDTGLDTMLPSTGGERQLNIILLNPESVGVGERSVWNMSVNAALVI